MKKNSLTPSTQHLIPKRAGIFDPYLDTLGGGERYCLTLAELLLNLDWKVDIFWEGKNLKPKIGERMGIDINRVSFIPKPKKILEMFKKYPKYDLLFFLSDGAIPFMFAKKNILHFQVPFKGAKVDHFLNKIKFKMIHRIVCNSMFTKEFIDREFKVKSEVIYPPVDVKKFKPGEKENIILSVGRFSRLLQAKNQTLLVEAFKNLVDQGLQGWKLVLAGGSEVGSGDLVTRLREMANGYPIEILENISLSRLSELYAKAKIFWAANGFGVDEKTNPEKVEHFGIAVAEAMSAGVVPLLVAKGGFKEIVEDGKSGFFWETIDEMEEKTLKLSKISLEKFQVEAEKRSQLFSKEKFNERFKRIIY